MHVFTLGNEAGVQWKYQGRAHKVQSSDGGFFHATETHPLSHRHLVRLIEPTL